MAVAETPADPYNSSRTWRSPGFDVLSFLVSHLFIYPVPLLCAGVYAIVYGSTAAKAVSLACLVGYTATMFDKAQFTGARAWMAFRRPWLGCHAYFPIVRQLPQVLDAPGRCGHLQFPFRRLPKCSTARAIHRPPAMATRGPTT